MVKVLKTRTLKNKLIKLLKSRQKKLVSHQLRRESLINGQVITIMPMVQKTSSTEMVSLEASIDTLK